MKSLKYLVQLFDEPKKFDQTFYHFSGLDRLLDRPRADENYLLSQFYNNQNGNKSIKT